MVISRDADTGFLALITFSAEDTDTDTDTDTGNLHTRYQRAVLKRTLKSSHKYDSSFLILH